MNHNHQQLQEENECLVITEIDDLRFPQADNHKREDLSRYSARQQAVIKNIRQAVTRINQKMESVSSYDVSPVTETCEASLPPDHREYLRAIHEWREAYKQFRRNPDQQADASSMDKLRALAHRALSTPSSVVQEFLKNEGVDGNTLRDLLTWQRQIEEYLAAHSSLYLRRMAEALKKQNDPIQDTSAACQTLPNHVTEPPEHHTTR